MLVRNNKFHLVFHEFETLFNLAFFSFQRRELKGVQRRKILNTALPPAPAPEASGGSLASAGPGTGAPPARREDFQVSYVSVVIIWSNPTNQ